MDHKLQKALYVILASLGLALVCNYLFFNHIPGISVFVFNIILLGSVFALGTYENVSFKKSWWLMGTILFFALMPAVRASGFLTFLNICTTFGLLVLLAHQLAGTPVFLMKLRDYILLAILVPFKMLGRALSTISVIGQIHSTVQKRDVGIRVIKGVIMAVPILIIFGLLFAQADLAFSQFLGNFIDITISERMVGHTIVIAFAFVATLSFLSYIFFSKSENSTTATEPINRHATGDPGRGIEILVFLSLVACLFLLFIGFQITYLFGGEVNVTSWGFTYAEYARRGFFELIAVCMLSLVLLFASEKYAGAEEKRNIYFLVPAIILIAEVMVVIASALKRLSLYIDAYNLTEPRFYVTAFILFLLALFILLAIKFMRTKPEHFFTFGTLVTGLIFLAMINCINPDNYIAKSSLTQYNQTGKTDVVYIGTLSADAAAQKIELYKKIQDRNKQDMQDLLEYQRETLQSNAQHWQSFNFSRSQALQLLQKL